MEWWFNNSGLNLLKGVEGDPDNPIRLSSAYIVDFLRRIPAARDSFNRLVPTMLEGEQTRLRALVAGWVQYALPDDKALEDRFQAAQNTVGIRTTGKYGGTRRGGNN